MKKSFIVLFMTIILLTAVGCGLINKEDEQVQSQHKMIIDGNELDCHDYLKIHESERFAELPVIAIMKALGADIKWLNKTSVLITYHSKEYLLDISNNSLSERGKYRNFIALPPGVSEGCYIFDQDEYVVGSDSFIEFLKFIGVKLTIDYDNSTVYIESPNR